MTAMDQRVKVSKETHRLLRRMQRDQIRREGMHVPFDVVIRRALETYQKDPA